MGRTLGKRLRELGWQIGAVVTRSPVTARAAVRAIGGGMASVVLSRDILEADVVLLTTPDSSLAAVASALADYGSAACRGKIVLHASGALDRSVLAPVARCGAATGSMHPLQAFSGRSVPKLAGVIFAIEGDSRARSVARKIARSLGGVPVMIDGKDKPAYHAAGVLVAGHTLALVESAVQILTRIGFSRRRAIEALLPLMRQILDNFEELGPRAAWTGPIERGDYAVVAKHKAALRSYPREFQQAYAALALLGAHVLSKDPAATVRQLERVFSNSRGGYR